MSLSDDRLDDLIGRAYQHDRTPVPDRFDDRFDEIHARAVAARQRAQRAWWSAYFAGRTPGFGPGLDHGVDEARGCRGVVFGLLLSLPVWVAIILLGRYWGWW